MNKKYYFISGLPRSGSTLTAGILKQNPRFQASMSSPIAGLFEGIIAQVSAGNEMASMVNEQQRKRLLKGLFESYYADYSEEVIFDTNRGWTAKLPALLAVFPYTKVICLVRDLAWIMDSMERQFRNNPFENTRIFGNAQQRATVYSRVEAMANPNGMVGYPWHALREACYSEHADRLLLVDYDLLVAKPQEVFKLLYGFIDEPYFEHEFDNVEYDAPEFDSDLGMKGLHRVHKVVAPRPRQTILPPDVFKEHHNKAFWRTLKNSKAYVISPD